MGCCGSLIPLDISSEEERIIYKNQLFLNFHKTKITNLISQFSSKESQGCISIRSLDEALVSLKIDPYFLSYPSNPVNAFYRSIGTGEQIEAKKLKIACILLGQGLEDVKALSLYQIYNSETLVMERAKFDQMIRDLFIVVIKLIWVAQGNDEDSLPKTRLRIYETKLLASISQSFGIIRTTVLNEEEVVSQDDFVAKLKNLPGGTNTIINPCKLREFIIKQYIPFAINSTSLFKATVEAAIFSLEDKQKPKISDPTHIYEQDISEQLEIDQNLPFTCDSGHDLKWHNDVPYFYYETFGTWKINCNKCHKKFSNSCWHCRECKYDLCEQCGNTRNMVPKKLYCSEPEPKELMWRCDVNNFYGKTFGCYSFSCNECGVVSEDAHWHCRNCLFDICRKCGLKRDYQYPISELNCRKGHVLKIEHEVARIYSIKYGTTPKCDDCRSEITSASYHCEDCDYDLCADCSGFGLKPLGPHPAFMCSEEHQLHYYDSQSFYSTMGLDKSFRCNSCKELKSEECFHCKKCKFDICTDCSDTLSKLIFKDSTVTCDNGHLLYWNPKSCKNYSGSAFSCNDCAEISKDIGSFNCAECNYDLCIKDMWKKANL